MDGQNVITLAIAFLTFAGVWYTGRVQLQRIRSEAELERQRLHTENSARLVSTALSVVDPLERRVAEQAVQIIELREELAKQKGLRQDLAAEAERTRNELVARIVALESELRAYEQKVEAFSVWIRAQGVDPEMIA